MTDTAEMTGPRAPQVALRQPKLSLGRKLGWGIGDLGFNIYWQALNLLMLPFYTDVLGLAPLLAGTVFLIASLVDGFADSVIGAVADRTRTRFGSYRPYLIYVSPFLVVVFMASFIGIEAGQTGLFLYALFSQIALRIVYSLVSIPYSTLSARITGDSDERSKLAGIRIAFAMLGGIIVTFLMPLVVDMMKAEFGDTSRLAYIAAAGIAGIVSLPIFWICFFSTEEPEQLRDANPEGFHWGMVWEDLKAIGLIARVNGPLLRVFACMIVSSLAFTMTNKCLVYYSTHYLGDPEFRKVLLPWVLFVNLVFCPVWAWVATRISKRKAWLLANMVSTIGYLAFWLYSGTDKAIASGLLGLISVGNAAYIMLVWAMIPDTVEYTEWKTGQRHDAKVFGIASFSKQLALGVNGFVLGALLFVIGYQEGSPSQSERAINGIKTIMTLVPLAGLALSAVIIWGYRLDRAYHREISDQAALARLSNKTDRS